MPNFQHGVYRLMSDSGLDEILKCNRPIDRFTVDPNNGNGELDYPVGLLTFDEMLIASFGAVSNINTSFLFTGNTYWSGTPNTMSRVIAYPGADYNGLIPELPALPHGVRPSISLKNGFTLTGTGDGTASNPYIVS